jgi:hypothetical protein
MMKPPIVWPASRSDKPDWLDWSCVLAFPIAGALGFLGTRMWFATGSQYHLRRSLGYLSAAVPALTYGVLVMLFPGAAYARFVRFRDYALRRLLGTDPVGVGPEHLRDLDRRLRVIFTFKLGACLVFFGRFFLFFTIRDTFAHPEYILPPATFSGNTW